eukprot:6757270-Pyramimonas_sp.AAC.1
MGFKPVWPQKNSAVEEWEVISYDFIAIKTLYNTSVACVTVTLVSHLTARRCGMHVTLVSRLCEHQARVGAPEAERVGHSGAPAGEGLRHFGHQIGHQVGVGGLQIEGGGCPAGVKRQHGEHLRVTRTV